MVYNNAWTISIGQTNLQCIHMQILGGVFGCIHVGCDGVLVIDHLHANSCVCLDCFIFSEGKYSGSCQSLSFIKDCQANGFASQRKSNVLKVYRRWRLGG